MTELEEVLKVLVVAEIPWEKVRVDAHMPGWVCLHHYLFMIGHSYPFSPGEGDFGLLFL